MKGREDANNIVVKKTRYHQMSKEREQKSTSDNKPKGERCHE